MSDSDRVPTSYSGLHEPSGEAESLFGKIDPKKFGDRVYRSTPPEKIQKKKRERFVVSETTMQNKKRRRILGEESSVLNWAEEGGVYQPKTKETRAAYESLLSLIQHQLCGQPLNIVSAAADEILAVLNDGYSNNSDKKKMEIEKVLNVSVSNKVFDKFVSIARFITDYQCDGHRDDEVLYDDDVGVAVDFEENEEDVEESDLDVVLDDGEEDEYVQLEGNVAGNMQMGSGGIDDEILQEADQGMALNVQYIDAYWLQRKISEAYEQQQIDPQQSQKLAEEVFKILAESGDDRDVETKLLVHLQYDKFSLIKYLLRNRLKVVWCTRLARAEDQEKRKKIEQEMLGLGPDHAAIL